MSSLFDLLKALFGRALAATTDTVRAYGRLVNTLLAFSAFVTLACLLAVIASPRHIGLVSVVVALLTAIWLIVAFPGITLLRTFAEFQPIKKTIQVVCGVLFWILQLAIYFNLVPTWNNPGAISLVLILSAALALGFARLGVTSNRRYAVISLLFIFALVTLSFFMPASSSAAASFLTWLDSVTAQTISDRTTPPPRRITYNPLSLESIDNIRFFDFKTGKPIVWYYLGDDGKYELFDNPGFHPVHGTRLKPVTEAIVQEIRRWAVNERRKIESGGDQKRDASVQTGSQAEPSYAPLPTSSEPTSSTRGSPPDANPALSSSSALVGPEASMPEAPEQKPLMSPHSQPEIVVPEGTSLFVRISTEISSDRNGAGEPFAAFLERPLTVGRMLVADKGSAVRGYIVVSRKADLANGEAFLGIRLVDLLTSCGEHIELNTDNYQVSNGTQRRLGVARIPPRVLRFHLQRPAIVRQNP